MSISTLWAGLTGFFSSKTGNDIFDKDDGILTKAGQWVNDLQFTEQERAKYDTETLKSWSIFVEKTLSENTERSKTRRNIAMMWIKNFWRLLWLMLLCVPIDYFLIYKGVSETPFLFNSIASVVFSGVVATGTIGVVGFFFGPYMLNQHLNLGNKNNDKKEA